jgi:hypothetical protein
MYFHPPNEKQRYLEAYMRYVPMKGWELNFILGQNYQYMNGKKGYCLEKCVDGEVFGRLALCPACGRKLRLKEGGVFVHCNGHWDVENGGRRVHCGYTSPVELCPRWNPWYVQKGLVHFRRFLRVT